MGTPTQVAGLASESAAPQQANGFLGWSPEADRSSYTVRNGADGTAAAAYTTLTVYAVGKTITDGGLTYVVRTAVTAANATPPASNVSFVLTDNHRGPSENADAVTRRKQYNR